MFECTLGIIKPSLTRIKWCGFIISKPIVKDIGFWVISVCENLVTNDIIF